MPLLIRGGTVVNHDHSRRADVLIDGDTIAAVAAKIDPPVGADIIDAGGCFVMPGGIDPHTHLERPFMGTTSADDFEWGTKAALASSRVFPAWARRLPRSRAARSPGRTVSFAPKGRWTLCGAAVMLLPAPHFGSRRESQL